MLRSAALLISALALTACSTYRSELHRGQRYYEETKYEAALALWRSLESNQSSLSAEERVRYAYFRGMTDYRLGFRSDARYWLSLAQAGEQLHPASLPGESLKRLETTLGELNEDVAVAAAPAAGDTGGTSTTEADPAGAPCDWSTECASGYICQDKTCVEL